MDFNNKTNISNVSNASFYQMDSLAIIAGRILPIFYCLIFVFGLFGNSMVIYVAIRKKNYQNITNCYIINLAIADLLFLTLSIPYTTYLGVTNDYPFSITVCRIYTYLAYGFLQATCNIIAVMSVDRYLYIVRPKSQLRWRTSRNTFLICILTWAGSLILIIPYHLISRIVTPDYSGCGMNEHGNIIVCLFPFCSYYAVPLIIIIVCYTNLALYVTRTGQHMADYMDKAHFHKTVQKKQRRVTRVVIAVTLAFAICWLPIHILELLKCSNPKLLDSLIRSFPRVLYGLRAFTHALAYFNSCLNPYLYAILNQSFCRDLAEVVPRWRFCCRYSKPNETNSNMLALRTSMRTKQIRDGDDDEDFDDDAPPSIKDDQCQMELLHLRS